MRPVEATPGERAVRAVPADALRSFERSFRGAVIAPGDERYDRARRVWNGLINRYPALVVRPTGVADVVAAVEFAREHGLQVSVRGGGHDVGGSAVNDGGVVVDCSALTGVRVDPEARTAQVEPGVRLGELYRETQRFGLAPPGGTAADTGVAGSTLGAGIGWMRRKHGLGIDNLRSVDLVTADGRFLTASESEHADLFWGIRGGGGSLGVVTSFEFDLHPVGPEVASAMVYYPGEAATDVLRGYRAYAASAPDEVTTMAFYTRAPDSASIPAHARGEPAVGVMACFVGPVAEGEAALGPLRELASPLVDYSGITPFVEFHDLAGTYPHGRCYYWTSLFLESLDDECIERLCERAVAAPSPLSSVTLWQLGGAVSRVDQSETAFAGRDAPYMVSVEANWDDPRACAENVGWARETRTDLHAFSTGGLYVNFAGLGNGGVDLARSAYGDNYERLADLKRRYDPTGLFRGNASVPLVA